MLGYVIHDDSDAGRARMAALADALTAEGLRLAGTVQVSSGRDMALRALGTDAAPIRISQPLGPEARGCRLDPDALERAVTLAVSALPGADLALVNKFGKQESLGRGFRDFIAAALAQDIPVLTAVAPNYLPAFTDFAGGLATPVSWSEAQAWCRRTLAAA